VKYGSSESESNFSMQIAKVPENFTLVREKKRIKFRICFTETSPHIFNGRTSEEYLYMMQMMVSACDVQTVNEGYFSRAQIITLQIYSLGKFPHEDFN
jgi:hypothetical protein